jgi:hypothetical protein
MHALEVKLDGVTLAVAGSPNAIFVAIHISSDIEQVGASLDISGMNDLGGERRSHTNWIMQQPLPPQARLELRLVETATATPPIREVAADDPEHLADQADYKRRLRDDPPVSRALQAVSPGASLALTLGGRRTVATLESGREFLMCSLLWDAWRPEQCRVRMSSFSQAEALAREGAREWTRAQLGLGESCLVEIGNQGDGVAVQC